MFFRLFKYSIMKSLRKKEIFFWNLCFPFILGTLFFVSFGNYSENLENFRTIPIAYVETENADAEFEAVLTELEQQDSPLVERNTVSLDEAQKLLEDGDVEGVYYNDKDGIILYVKEEGIFPSILKTVLDEYQKTSNAIATIAEKHPENLMAVLDNISTEVNMLTEKPTSSGNLDTMVSYFYALIAMSCLYGCFTGVNCAVDIKADKSALGARRLVASTNRFSMMLADIAASIALQFFCSELAVCYLKYVLKVDFGRRMPYLALVVLVGSIIGIATGFFIGSVGKAPIEGKIGMAVGITMLECFLSGLMVGNMYYIIQDICPLINKINPASLIVDALYSLDIYDTYERFYGNLGLMLGISVLLGGLGYLSIRRERYASI